MADEPALGLVTLVDRASLVVCWMMDTIVVFVVVLVGCLAATSWAPAPLDAVLAMGLFVGIVLLVAVASRRHLGIDISGDGIVIRNLFRRTVIPTDVVEGVGEGRWGSLSFVQRAGEPAYLQLRQRASGYLLPRRRVPVHSTFRWANEQRQATARSQLERLLADVLKSR